MPIDGTEQVILGDLSLLADGVPVQVGPAPEGTRLVRETAVTKPRAANTEGGAGPVEAANQPIGRDKSKL